jgi:tRNA pseudouridine55 synthase
MNWTSQDVVKSLRLTLEKSLKNQGHRFHRNNKLKVGHGGTLDPMATGMLVVAVGDTCKDLTSFLKGAKAYSATAQLGAETDTQDSEGQITSTATFDHVTLEDLERAAKSLTGDIMQRPPIYSALKRDGKKLCDLAREGKISENDIEPRPVTIHRLDVTNFDKAAGTFDLDVSSSGGTYIRVLISDIGRAVGSAAHMVALERTKHGPFCKIGMEKQVTLGSDVAIGVEPFGQEDFREPAKIMEALERSREALQGGGITFPDHPPASRSRTSQRTSRGGARSRESRQTSRSQFAGESTAGARQASRPREGRERSAATPPARQVMRF